MGKAQTGERGVYDQTEAFPREVIDQRQNAKAPAAHQCVGHEVERPAQVTILRDSHWSPGAEGSFASAALAHGHSYASSISTADFIVIFVLKVPLRKSGTLSPTDTPERGVTGYEDDRTQGPACAIAAGAATIYRNYFAPLGDGQGQTVEKQFDGLADIGAALSQALDQPVSALWKMQNGYALCTQAGLHAIAEHLGAVQPEQLDILRGKLCIGIHSDVEVTDASGEGGPLVSQAFCSALPVAYSRVPSGYWEPFARLVLEAAYEATMWAAVQNAQRGASNIVLLTFLGGGAFGNEDRWVHGAMQRALKMFSGFELDVRLVSYGTPSRAIVKLAEKFG